MTIKHQMWLADAVVWSALALAAFFILLEFSKARLPSSSAPSGAIITSA